MVTGQDHRVGAHDGRLRQHGGKNRRPLPPHLREDSSAGIVLGHQVGVLGRSMVVPARCQLTKDLGPEAGPCPAPAAAGHPSLPRGRAAMPLAVVRRGGLGLDDAAELGTDSR